MQNNDSPLDIGLDDSGSIASMGVVIDQREVVILARGVRDLEESDFSARDGGEESTDDVAGILLGEGEGNAREGKKGRKPHCQEVKRV